MILPKTPRVVPLLPVGTIAGNVPVATLKAQTMDPIELQQFLEELRREVLRLQALHP